MKNSFEPVRYPCAHVDFCPRNAEPGSEFCDLHQHQPTRVVASDLVTKPVLLGEPRPAKPEDIEESPPYPFRSDHSGGRLEDFELGYDDLIVGGQIGKRIRNLRAGFYKPEPKKVEALLTFTREGSSLVASTQCPFRPLGLMLWNADELSIEAHLVGNRNEITCSFGKVPALWYQTSQSFEQVQKAIEEGKLPGRGWGSWPTVSPGLLVRLLFDGDVSRVKALMWGYSVR